MFAFQDNHKTILKRDHSHEEDLKKWTDDLNTEKKPDRDIYQLSGPETEQNLRLVREISSHLQQLVGDQEVNKAEEKEVQVKKTAGNIYADGDKIDATEEKKLNLAKTAVKPEIQNFFTAQKVVATGGTGLLGKGIPDQVAAKMLTGGRPDLRASRGSDNYQVHL